MGLKRYVYLLIMPRSSFSQVSKSSQSSLPLPLPVPYVPKPSFLQSVKDGFAVGTGAHIARHMVDKVLGSPTNPTLPPPAPTSTPISQNPCAFIQKEFDQCVRAHIPEDMCQKEMELLNKCLKNQ